MEDEFQKWLEQKNVGWYLNEWLNKVEDERKEQNEHDEMVYKCKNS